MSSCNEHNSRVFIPHSLKQGYLKRSQWMNFFDISRNWRPRLHCHMWKVISEIHCQRFVMSHACTLSRLKHPHFLSPFLPSIVLRIRFASKVTLKWQRNTTFLSRSCIHFFLHLYFLRIIFSTVALIHPAACHVTPWFTHAVLSCHFLIQVSSRKLLFSRVVAFKNKTSKSYTVSPGPEDGFESEWVLSNTYRWPKSKISDL